jgi:hypothetical protein
LHAKLEHRRSVFADRTVHLLEYLQLPPLLVSDYLGHHVDLRNPADGLNYHAQLLKHNADNNTYFAVFDDASGAWLSLRLLEVHVTGVIEPPPDAQDVLATTICWLCRTSTDENTDMDVLSPKRPVSMSSQLVATASSDAPMPLSPSQRPHASTVTSFTPARKGHSSSGHSATSPTTASACWVACDCCPRRAHVACVRAWQATVGVPKSTTSDVAGAATSGGGSTATSSAPVSTSSATTGKTP